MTGLTRGVFPKAETEEGKRFIARTSVIPRYGQPEDLAGAALYLASDLASYVTGQSIVVDGGLSDAYPKCSRLIARALAVCRRRTRGEKAMNYADADEPTKAAIIQRVIDRQEITDVLMRYSRGVDRIDIETLAKCYWEDALEDHGIYVGSIKEFLEFIPSGNAIRIRLT